MEKATILIIDTEETSIKELIEKREEYMLVGSTNNLDIGFTLAEKHQPTIILLCIDLETGMGSALAELITTEFPLSNVILVTKSDNKKILRHALQVGAKDVISMPLDTEKLYKILNRIIISEQKRKKLFTVRKKDRPQFKTITVFSTKGGVGKTTVALNLAIAIRQLTTKRVVLVDLDFISGNAAIMAGIELKRSIKDLVDEYNNLDKEMIDSYCIPHPSGIQILPAPSHPEFAGFIEAEHVEKVLAVLSQVFNYVIVDAPTYLHDTVIPALEQSQDILLVTTVDLAAILNLKQSLDLLTQLALRPKVKVVINKVGYTGGLKVEDLENELGMKVRAIIPNNEKQAINAVNLGNPLYLSAKSSSAAQKIRDLAESLIIEEEHAGVYGKVN